MATHSVRHWRRGEDDRLYVSTTAGRLLGWYDVRTRSAHPVDDASHGQLLRAVTRYELREPIETPPQANDLAAARPGAAETANAERCVGEMPLFSAVGAQCGERTDESDWRRSARSAVAAAQSVASAPGNWRALHAVPIGNGAEHLDHLLIGPAGVVLVLHEYVGVSDDVRTLGAVVDGATVWFDGIAHKLVRHLGRLADSVGERLAVVDVSVVVAVHGGGVTVRRPAADARVRVVVAEALGGHLASLAPALSEAEVDAVFDLARWRGTWRPHERVTVRRVDAVGLPLLAEHDDVRRGFVLPRISGGVNDTAA